MKEFLVREAREKAGLTLRQAAHELGISHAYLSGLELGHKALSPERAQELVKLYRLSPNTTLLQPAPTDKGDFQTWLNNQIKWWDSRFVLPTLPGVSRLISSLYIDPIVSVEGRGRKRFDKILPSLLNGSTNQALLLSGGIGTGKSFLLRMVALEPERFLKPKERTERIVPFLVSIGQFNPTASGIAADLSEYYCRLGFPGSQVQLSQFIKQCLERGNALFLFDGLDEIREQQRRARVFALLQQSFENELRSSGCQMIISGRPEVLLDRDLTYNGFVHAQLEPWSSLQMLEASRRWNSVEEEANNTFLPLLQVNDLIFRLARWPLLFHLLNTLHLVSGLNAFHGRSIVCDDCCRVFENSWDSARRTFNTSQSSQEELGVNHSWVKWRHFLIHLMERDIARAEAEGQLLSSSFSEADIRDAWEDFLTLRGVDRKSLDFAKLEGIISNQNRCGPLIKTRAIPATLWGRPLRHEFSFIDPLFRDYYYAKALLNRPEQLKQVCVTHLRDPQYQDIIPLLIEELGRSERIYENRLADELFDVLMSADDELHIEKECHIGHFGLFAATRSIGAFNPDRYFEKIIKPFLSVYMNSMFVSDAEETNEILGQLSSSVRIRDFFYARFHEIFSEGHAHDPTFWEEKWRVLAGLGRFGEQQDLIAEEVVHDAGLFGKSLGKESLSDAINMRRLLLCLRQIGRIFVLEGKLTADGESKKLGRIQKIKDAIREFVEFALASIAKQRESGNYLPFHFWDALTAIPLTFEQLRYEDELQSVLSRLVEFCHSQRLLMKRDPETHRRGFIQFLKGVSSYTSSLSEANRKAVLEIAELLSAAETGWENRELALIKACLETPSSKLSEQERQWEILSNVYLDDKPLSTITLIQKVESFSKAQTGSHSELGSSIAILYFALKYERISINLTDRLQLIATLQAAMKQELIAPEEKKDAERTYTRPFGGYAFPLYDHLYDCLCLLARKLPVTTN